ncbi:MAG: hypothetical protein ABIG95_06935 [Candidatus Woesearchaeota archaeon]
MAEDEEDEYDIYSDEGREELVEDDAIEPWEEGFMKGADGMGQDAKCRYCGEIFTGPDSVIEEEIDGEILRFCSEGCAEKYKKKH